MTLCTTHMELMLHFQSQSADSLSDLFSHQLCCVVCEWMDGSADVVKQ
jgi:hypothetical protein